MTDKTREQVENFLKTRPEVRFWNTSDAMCAAWQASRTAALEWQPIETAPKGGTLILVGSARDGYTTEAQFDTEREEWWEVNTHWTDATGDPLYPTHWMPLPAPPVGSVGGGKE
jgi:hypothetical protein